MGMEIMQGSYGLQWVPVDDNAGSYDTLYVGQLVKSASDGVLPLGTAGSGLTVFSAQSVYGIVVGTNLRTPSFDTTYKAEKITSVAPHANTVEYCLSGGSGKVPVGDTAAYVLVDRVGPGTVIKAPIFNAAYGTAITVGVVTTGNTSGTGFTCSAGLLDFSGTVVADRNTAYFRTGANRGIYRVCTDASATVKTVDHDFPFDIVAGDTAVAVHLRPWGLCVTQFDGESTYVNAYADTGTNYYTIEVLSLDLSEAGKEHVIFRLVY